MVNLLFQSKVRIESNTQFYSNLAIYHLTFVLRSFCTWPLVPMLALPSPIARCTDHTSQFTH